MCCRKEHLNKDNYKQRPHVAASPRCQTLKSRRLLGGWGGGGGAVSSVFQPVKHLHQQVLSIIPPIAIPPLSVYLYCIFLHHVTRFWSLCLLKSNSSSHELLMHCIEDAVCAAISKCGRSLQLHIMQYSLCTSALSIRSLTNANLFFLGFSRFCKFSRDVGISGLPRVWVCTRDFSFLNWFWRNNFLLWS